MEPWKMITTERNNRMKEDISSLRKQLTEEYEGRENFLDNFCRQATNNNIVLSKDTTNKKRPPASGTIHTKESTAISLSNNRQKNKLLAALKNIDNDSKL